MPPSSGKRLYRVALREDVELEAVGHAELVVDAAQMIAQRVLADMQARREAPVVRARVGDELRDDLALARGKRGDAAVLGVGRGAVFTARKLDEDAPGGRAVEPQLAAVHLFDRPQQGLGRLFLLHEPGSAAQDRLLARAAVAHAGPDEHPGAAAVPQHRDY